MEFMRKLTVITTKGIFQPTAQPRFQSVFQPVIQRTIATAPYTRKISNDIQLFQSEEGSNRPLVLLLGWLFAKPKYLHKYGEFYMNQGFDVISVQIHLNQVFSPKKAQMKAADVLDLLKKQSSRSTDLLVHSFSVGGYIYGEMLVHMQQNNEKYADVIKMMKGTIYDSPVDYNGIPVGVSKAMTDNKTIQHLTESSIRSVMNGRKTAAVDYLKASNAFHENKLHIPGLFLYSLSDPVIEPTKYEGILENWRQNDIHAESKVWKDGLHVSVYSKYPEEYLQAVKSFIKNTKIDV